MTCVARPSLSVLLLAVLAGCMTSPSDLDLSLEHPSQDSRYVVTLQPPAAPAALQQIHSWQVMLRSPDGLPVTGGHFVVDGGMPQHGHGLPTAPQVTKDLGGGRYLVEGMKFNMPGWWELQLGIEGPAGADAVTFNLVL